MKFSNKDIVLQDNGALYYFRFLLWDTEFFGLPSYSLDLEKSYIVATPAVTDSMDTQLSGAFVTAKVDTSKDYEIVNFLMQCGFQYIDTEVTLERNVIPDESILRENIAITKLEDNKRLPYEKLGSVYSLTRFHTDPHISTKKADQLWVNYLKNYVADSGHHIFAAMVKNEVAGVVLVDVDDSTAVLSFVSVRQRYQGQGIGSLLIQKVIDNFKGKCMTVGTQVKNPGALNFYIQNGFSRIRYTKTILHRW
jgi:ribosomal protein S18 acetylase RimI-like enzyme